MQVSVNWLNEFVDLSNIEDSQLAHELTMSGLEVESIEEVKPQAIINLGLGYEWQYLDIDITMQRRLLYAELKIFKQGKSYHTQVSAAKFLTEKPENNLN